MVHQKTWPFLMKSLHLSMSSCDASGGKIKSIFWSHAAFHQMEKWMVVMTHPLIFLMSAKLQVLSELWLANMRRKVSMTIVVHFLMLPSFWCFATHLLQRCTQVNTVFLKVCLHFEVNCTRQVPSTADEMVCSNTHFVFFSLTHKFILDSASRQIVLLTMFLLNNDHISSFCHILSWMHAPELVCWPDHLHRTNFPHRTPC